MGVLASQKSKDPRHQGKKDGEIVSSQSVLSLRTMNRPLSAISVEWGLALGKLSAVLLFLGVSTPVVLVFLSFFLPL